MLSEPVKTLLRSKGVESLFAIQAQTLPHGMAGKGELPFNSLSSPLLLHLSHQLALQPGGLHVVDSAGMCVSVSGTYTQLLWPDRAYNHLAVPSLADLVGRARTGCGKTYAFTLPIVERLLAEQRNGAGRPSARGRLPCVIVMAPTRELAKQVGGVGGNGSAAQALCFVMMMTTQHVVASIALSPAMACLTDCRSMRTLTTLARRQTCQ